MCVTIKIGGGGGSPQQSKPKGGFMRIHVHMSQELKDKINAEAKAESRSVSNMVAVLITEALKAREGE